MNAPAIIPSETLPALIDKASAALANARSSAEVLEARDFARAAYDAAKSAARMSKAKQAHDSILAEVHRAQGHALAIRSRAEMRLAEEYDAAQDRGEVASNGQRGSEKAVEKHNGFSPATAADLGLRRDEIHEARKLRDAEQAEPGLIQRAINAMVERGEEPTRSALRREVIERPAPKVMDATALWVWGRVNDFDRQGVLRKNPASILSEMTDPMRGDMRRVLPSLVEFLSEMENGL